MIFSAFTAAVLSAIAAVMDIRTMIFLAITAAVLTFIALVMDIRSRW